MHKEAELVREQLPTAKACIRFVYSVTLLTSSEMRLVGERLLTLTEFMFLTCMSSLV